LLIAIPVLFLGLGANSIWDANEAFYVETPRQMVETGDFVTPSFNGEPRLNKPVLSYWIVAGFYQVFGVSVETERLAIALAAAGILWGAFLIGQALRSPLAGTIAALLLVTSPRFVFFSRRIAIDVFLTCFMTLALACYVLAERYPPRRRVFLALMYGAIGLGVLTKGPIAIAIPALALFAFLASEGRLRTELPRLWLPGGALIVAVVVLPWYIALYATHGWEPLRFFFIEENLGRYASAFTTDRSVFFFILVLFGDILMPWAPLIAVALVSAWQRPAVRDPDHPAGGRRLLFWWIAVTVGIFTLSASKEDLYILPAIPAAAVLIADLLERTDLGARHRGVRAVLAIVGGVAAAIGVLIFELLSDGYYKVAGARVMAGVLAAGGVFCIAAIVRRRPAVAFAALSFAFIVFNYLFVVVALPDVERLKPVPHLARILSERAPPAARVGSFNMDLPSLTYHANRRVERLTSPEAAQEFLTPGRDSWLVTGEGEWSNLQPLHPQACLVARYPMFVAKGSDILRGQAPPPVLLVRSVCRAPRVSSGR
jgi:4-amino-4-deoxy-L-arabinose transferase-like glycosyltransferase